LKGISSAIVILAALLLLLPGCASQNEGKQPLTIVLSNWPASYYIHIAQQNGHFREQGLEAQIISRPDYTSALAAFQSNRSLDCLHILSTDLFALRENGVKAKMVLPMDISDGGDALAAAPGISGIGQLRGKTIGVEGFNSFSHLFAIKLLEKHNLAEGDVYFKIVSSVDVPGKIASGEIDAGHVYASSLSDALSRGQALVGDSSETPGLIFDGIACRERAISEKPQDMQAMADSWFAAERFARENPGRAAEAISIILGVPSSEVAQSISGVRIFDLQGGKQAFSESGGPGTLLSNLEVTNAFLLERGQASGDVEPHELIETSFMQNAK